MSVEMWRPGSTSQILIGIGCGIVLGVGLKTWTCQPWSERDIMYLQFPGELFLRAVNCLILPLVIASIVSASSSDISSDDSGSIGLKALLYYITTTTLGITLSVFLSQTIRPGEWGSDTANRTSSLVDNYSSTPPHQDGRTEVKFVTTDTLLDLLRNLLPENLVQATLSQYQTVLVEGGGGGGAASGKAEEILAAAGTSAINQRSIYELGISHRYTSGTNVLGLVFAGLVFGLTLGRQAFKPDHQKEPLRAFFKSLADAISHITDSLIKLAPVAVVFLISAKILKSDESGLAFARLGIFVVTVFLGLFVQALLVLPLLYALATRKSPLRILRNIGPALVTAFGTSSSTATVPTTLRCLDKLGIDRQVSRFVAPIGATINMDGIALYETIGALFIMQMRGLDLSLVQTIAVSITCTLSCVGAAGIPSGGYAMLIMVLNSLGIPADDVALIIAVDSFVDRFRTMVNIVADCLGSGIIDEMIQKEKRISINCDKNYNVVPANEKEGVVSSL